MVSAPTRRPRTTERAEPSGPLPLSSGQRQMWLLHQLAPADRAYLMTWTLRLSGPLDTEALRRAWERLTERHGILRTRYVQTGAQPHQLVDPPGPFALRTVDLAEEEAADPQERAEQIAAWERGRPFDLTRHHPLRVTLLRLSPTSHLMVVSVHHIACDEDSYRVLAAELDALYAAETAGVAARLPEPPPQYADFAVREQQRGTEAALRPHLDHWRTVLGGARGRPLPLDHPREGRADRRGAEVALAIAPETATGVRALAAAHRATPYMVLLAAYHVMLARLTGSGDVTVGVPVSTRTPDMDGLLGYTVNTVAVRSQRAPGQTFADVVREVRTAVLDAMDHRFAPFERVVEEVNPSRGLDENPLFQAAFDMEDAGGAGGFRLAGLEVERVGPALPPDVKFDLTLHAAADGAGLHARLEYAAALVEEPTARAWADDWSALLADLVAHPDAPLAPPPEDAEDPAPAPVPARAVAAPGAADAVPDDATARTVHRIWAEVLELGAAGPQDNFFDAGGDSLRAVALAGALRAEGFDVSAADVFAHQTAEELAAWCARRPAGADGAAVLPPAVEPFALLAPQDRAALPADVVDAYPLTATQLGMIIELRARPDVNTYQDTTSYLVRDPEPLDHAALQQATQRVVDRHEVLRTGFDLGTYSVPLQLVHAAARIEVGRSAHGPLGPGGWRPLLEEYAAAERSSPMDIARAPLIRVHAHTATGAGEWWITITECHPILEGWSFHTMLMEILTGYRELTAGHAPAEPAPVPFRYADYVAAEHAARASDEHRDFWRAVVAGRSDTALPASWQGDRSLPRERYQDLVDFRDLEDDLRRLATATGTSLKAVLLAAHMKVMSAVTATEDFYTGLVCDARPEAVGADQVLGMYLNTLPFAMPSGARTWGDLVRAVHDALTALWPHRVFPMQMVQQEFGPGGRLLDVFFNYLDFRQVDQSLFDWDATYNDNDNEFALHVFTISGILKVNTTSHRLGRAAARRLLALYRSVLEHMSRGPEGSAQAACLPVAERGVLAALDRSGDPAPHVPALFDAFTKAVRANPEAVALRYGEQRVTYAALDDRVRALTGAAGNTVAGEAASAASAVSGGTARAVPDATADPAAAPTPAPETPTPLDLVAAVLAASRLGTPYAPPAAPHLSFSPTGTAAAVARLRTVLADRGVAPAAGSVWLCAHGAASPDGLLALLAALASGATAVLAGGPLPGSLPELARIVGTGEVTHLSATPLVAERLLGEDALPLAVVLGGDDGAGPALVDLLRSKVRAVETLLPAGLGVPPVCDGTPPPGVSLDVVDDRGRPLPVGVVGEVRVRVGTSLRTGALLHAGTPLRTGRLARVRPDGRLDPMGPLGPYRTRELLALDPSVLDCRVAESASRAGGRRLVGHVRTLPGAQWDPDAIRRRLAERRLPRPLIPDVLVQVAQWPLDAAGTVDGALLPAPDEAAEPVDPAAAAQGEPWDEEFGALLRGALAETAWTGDLDPDVPLADAGLGSMATVGLMVAIEQLYDLVLPDDFQIIDMFRTPRTLWQDIRAFRDAAS